MNYKKKWQSTLMKQLREKGEIEITTRNATEIAYMTELKEVGKITLTPPTSGVWICRLKESEPKKA